MASPQLITTILLLVLCSVIATSGASDLQSDRAALLAFYDAFRPQRLHWNATASPCSWTGVRCVSGRVASLRLPAIHLLGSIPAGSVGNLTALRTLSLHRNSLSGPLPSDITGASRLRKLYLQDNSLSGETPRALSTLRLLERLNLEYNNFSGELPDIDLPMLEQFNVSYNHLTGAIPFSFRKWPASAFLDMPLCGGSLTSCIDDISPAEAPAPVGGPGPGRKTDKLSRGVIAVIVIGVFAVAVLVVILYHFPDMIDPKRGSRVRSVGLPDNPAGQ